MKPMKLTIDETSAIFNLNCRVRQKTYVSARQPAADLDRGLEHRLLVAVRQPEPGRAEAIAHDPGQVHVPNGDVAECRGRGGVGWRPTAVLARHADRRRGA